MSCISLYQISVTSLEKKKDSKINIDKKYSSFMQRVSVEVEHGCERDVKNK